MEGWKLRARDIDWATGKIEKAERPHSSNFEERIPLEYPLCQLHCWLAFEWEAKTLQREPYRPVGLEGRGKKAKSKAPHAKSP
jgi:hypothetical protein